MPDPTPQQKLQAHAEHLLDVFIGLREKYAFLHPMIFEQAIAVYWGGGDRLRGFLILKNTMFMSCLIDVCKLAVDKDDRTPSVLRLVDALNDTTLLAALREEYAVWPLVPSRGEPPEVISALERMRDREEAQRREEFDRNVRGLQELWTAFSRSERLRSCQMMRDKFLAHSELHHTGDGYRPLDVSALGLKWSDLSDLVASLEELIVLVTLIYRGASFAFDMLEDQLRSAATAFWARQ